MVIEPRGPISAGMAEEIALYQADGLPSVRIRDSKI